jgi:hypothetical protein
MWPGKREKWAGIRTVGYSPKVIETNVARSFALLVLVGLGLAADGCAAVAPYERETLARRDMELSGKAPLRAGEEHAQAYREGSSGGGDAKGGGCGCN